MDNNLIDMVNDMVILIKPILKEFNLNITEETYTDICTKILKKDDNLNIINKINLIKKEDFSSIEKISNDISSVLLSEDELSSLTLTQYKEIVKKLYKLVVDLNNIYVREYYIINTLIIDNNINMAIINNNETIILDEFESRNLISKIIIQLSHRTFLHSSKDIDFKVTHKLKNGNTISSTISLSVYEMMFIINNYIEKLNTIYDSSDIKNAKYDKCIGSVPDYLSEENDIIITSGNLTTTNNTIPLSFNCDDDDDGGKFTLI